MKRVYFLLLILLLCINFVDSATLYGNIYTWDLENAENIYVTIGSIPKQSMISIDGGYSFELNPGNYELKAEQRVEGEVISSSTEEVIITEEGNFRLDIILFPEFDETPEDINLTEIDLDGKDTNYWLIIISLILIIVLFWLILMKKRKPKLAIIEDDEANNVIELIKKANGRITQKEIRKSLAMSEAKLSLIITELQHKQKIEKIKKGRGNIIILKK